MSRVRAVALGVGMVLVAAAPAQQPKDAPLADKLVGAWKVTEGTKAGEKASDDAAKATVTITKDTITLKSEAGTFEFKYKLDAKATPAAVDLEMTEPDFFKGTKAKGLVKLDGETLTLCYVPPKDMEKESAERPKGFESTKDNRVYLFKMKKADAK